MTIFYYVATAFISYILGIVTISLVSNHSGYDKGFRDGYDLAKQDSL